MDKRLSINTFNFIGDILGAVLTGTMLLWMFTDATVGLYYGFGVVMLVTNIIGLVKMKKAKSKTVGNILGVIASALHMLTGLLAIPAMVLYIIASVFTFKNKVCYITE
ncbi:hypothetical protein [Clostridium sp.]|jgi:hypothetical protein|uniref:hypothetical protein n=2 Tax=Clostridium TaxID=1485 RepID=UPI0025BA4E03|nr:hypothetical protein [Clostridium sp.]MCI9069661.1 hypothetical protein [Clostridium sp.]MCI9303133.1 hypothetical protein [Clostridium sp.]